MSQRQSHQKVVGTFLAIGLFVILFSIFLLGGDRKFLKPQVEMKAHFDQVQGLNDGSVVSLSGINIGNVKEINFVPKSSKLEVIMTIDKEFAEKITEGSTVSVRTQGALGDKFVFINPGPTDAKILSPSEIIPSETDNDLMGVISNRGGEAAKIFDILDEIHLFTKNLNEKHLISNLSEASQNLKLTASESQLLIKELRAANPQRLRQSFDKLESILGKIDRGEGSLGALINDPTVHEQLKGILGADNKKKTIKSLIRTSIEDKQ